MTTDHQGLEQAIDAAAQHLTAGDPPAHFSVRVLARLDERRRSPWMWWTAAACAIGVSVAAGVLGVRDRTVSPVAPRTQAKPMNPGPNERLAVRREIVAPDSPAPTGREEPKRVSREAQVTSRAPSADEFAWHARAVPALDTLDPLTLDDIQPTPLEIRPLVTAPLTVPAIVDDENRNQDGPRP
jgi:hypothetical protein